MKALLRDVPFSTGCWGERGVRRDRPVLDPHGSFPLLRARFRLKGWADGASPPLDLYLDTGADVSHIRREWFELHGDAPLVDEAGRLDGACEIEVGGRWLALPFETGPIVARFADEPARWGSEDALLGRDFLGAHRLRVTFDFGRACFSIEQPSGETTGGSPARGRETD